METFSDSRGFESSGFAGHLGDARAFCEVVNRGTITAAARELGETKGAISRRIGRLEDRLGVHLLARSPRRVAATDEGLAFFDRASRALQQLDEAADAARGLAIVPRGRLRISAPVDLAIDVLAPVLVAFRTAHPRITLDVRVDNALVDLAVERIDLALRATAVPPPPPYECSEIAPLDLALFAAPDWIRRHGEPASHDDLQPGSVIGSNLPGLPLLTLRNAAGGRMQLPEHCDIAAGDFPTAKALAIAGGGVVLLPEAITRRNVERGELVRVLLEWRVAGPRLWAVSLGGREEPARSRLFRAFLASALS